MIYAPMLIPTLCRSEHFIREIESLKRNTWAMYTDVYVAVDYPTKETHWKGYKEICRYLNNGDFTTFKSFNVIKRERNYGSARNMISLREKVLQQYDRFIRTDDDCEFAPSFLEYMNKCLDRYADDDSVMGVTGYSYPVDWQIKDGCNTFLNQSIFPMWGTGFWKSKFEMMEDDLQNLYIKKQYAAGRIHRNKMTDARYIEALAEASSNDKESILEKVSDMSCGIYIQLADKYVVTPKKSLVRNYGFDGTGMYCQDTSHGGANQDHASTYDYRLQPIDNIVEFEPDVDENVDVIFNNKLLNKFDNRSRGQILKRRIKTTVKIALSRFTNKGGYGHEVNVLRFYPSFVYAFNECRMRVAA